MRTSVSKIIHRYFLLFLRTVKTLKLEFSYRDMSRVTRRGILSVLNFSLLMARELSTLRKL